MVGRAALRPRDRSNRVGLAERGHVPVGVGLEVRLDLLELSESRRVSRLRFRRRERVRIAVLDPEVQRPLRVREDVEERRERRTPVPCELLRGDLLERLKLVPARRGDVGEPLSQGVRFGDHELPPSWVHRDACSPEAGWAPSGDVPHAFTWG
jgi:hypothetical protein